MANNLTFPSGMSAPKRASFSSSSPAALSFFPSSSFPILRSFHSPQTHSYPLPAPAMASLDRKFVSFLLLLLTSLVAAAAEAGLGIDAGDRDALLRFRSQLNDPRLSLASWNGSNCTTWAGISCENRTGRVVGIDLGDSGLSGAALPLLCNLSLLETLVLSGNDFSGPIPHCFGRLQALRTLDLGRNKLQGSLPPEMAGLWRLEELVLAGNPGVGGLFPEWIGTFSYRLNRLDLGSTSVQGEIPEGLFHLSSLKFLDLSGNCLVGDLKDFEQPLVLLNLAQNQLSGTLPCFSASAGSLSVLNLAGNALVGGIPTCISSLRALTELNLSSNGLQYRISPRLIFSDKLLVLDLSSNELSGPIPGSLVEEPERAELLLLNLSSNQLSGEIPAEMTELRSLQGLFLSQNQLTGEIPVAIGNLTYLQSLDLSYNLLSGPIPVSLAGCFQLWQLKLDHNNLSGALHPELDALDSLRILDLAGNRISGEIPLPLAGCKSLEVVDLSSNELGGELSGAILKWQNLRFLSLARNHFSGDLPNWMFSFQYLRSLNLSGNHFSGFIPDGDFNVSDEFNGNSNEPYDGFSMVLVPVSVNFAGSRQLEFNYKLHSQVGIDLSNNALRGEIPEGLIGLRGLEYLNLSYNDLTGRIPGNLEKMGKLKRLDLSHNSLSGEVPASISGLRELEALNLSYNCLSGPVPTREGLQRFPGAFAGNPALCMEFSGKGCDTEASLPAGKVIGASGGGDDGWMSVGAFWISASSRWLELFITTHCAQSLAAALWCRRRRGDLKKKKKGHHASRRCATLVDVLRDVVVDGPISYLREVSDRPLFFGLPKDSGFTSCFSPSMTARRCRKHALNKVLAVAAPARSPCSPSITGSVGNPFLLIRRIGFF
ncbi:hypothetical protein B296_00037080 [Ensete ventricosum]|uniref:Leucine-rich repeat-containing N-terminal plant-type domain-containing protein n=1 Tax=Ensete ventricosum TaxID=4639 RepID=A0A426XR66_ENSVE|nr:hypothetical protein B296_00037080 [Ensete ventricosum]